MANKKLNLKNVSSSAISMMMNSIYGDGSYMNSKEYQELYNEMQTELIKRSKV